MRSEVTDRKLLVIENDSEVWTPLKTYFTERGNQVRIAKTLESGITLLKAEVFDGVILDLLLPDGEGLELFSLMDSTLLPPVVILSMLSAEETMLEGFSLGACDYVVKPCSPALLEARLALRLLPQTERLISLHGVTVNSNTRTVTYENVSIGMTGSEFNILWFLISHAGQFFSADTIYEYIWKEKSLNQTSIRGHICHLRNKLLKHTGKQLIITEFNKGYKFLSEREV